MKKIYLVVFCIISSQICSAQATFQSAYGDIITDAGKVIITTSDGGYCIVGVSGQNTADSSDAVIYKLNSWGELTWSVKVGLPGDEIPAGVVELPTGGYIVTGTTRISRFDTVHTEIFAFHITGFGGFITWSKVYGGPDDDEANSIIPTPDGYYLILGSTKSFGSATKSALAMKINDTGDQQWCTVCSTTSDNFFNAGDISSDHNFILGGAAFNGTDYDNYIVKMDSMGGVTWSRRYGTTGNDIVNDIITATDHGYIIAGTGTANTAGDTDQCVIKLDSSGNASWAYNYGTVNYDLSASVVETQNNSFIVCGYITDVTASSSLNQMVLEEIDNTGTLVWANTYGINTSVSEGYNIIHGVDGGFAACGFSDAFGDPNGDAYFVKTDDAGLSGCFETPIVLIRNTITLTDSSGSVSASILLNEIIDTTNLTAYTDQFSQNCFFDNVLTISQNNSAKVFPNPASGSISVELNSVDGIVTISDVSGRFIKSKKLAESISTIDISELTSGIYFIEIKSENCYSRNRFIKE